MTRSSFASLLLALPLSLLVGCGGGGSGSSGNSTSSGEPQILLSSSSLTFTGVAINSISAAQTVTVKNSGDSSLTLTSIVLNDTTNYALTNSCGTTLAAGATCNLSVVFQPKSTATLNSTIRITDNSQNVSGNFQDITLSSTSTAATTPVATLSASSLSFSTTVVNNSSSLNLTLSNTGTSTTPLTVSSVALSGTNSNMFSTTNTCTAGLAAAGTCTITVKFTPTAAATYTGTLTVTDNSNGVSGSTQTVSLTGTGTTTAPTVVYKLYELPDPGAGLPGGGMTTALYALVDNATSTIDMSMYALQDSTMLSKMVAACGRGVIVRAALDGRNEKSNNASAFSTLNSTTNCSAVYANTAFQAFHEKSMIVDKSTLVLMSGNLQSQYYSTTRDYFMVFNDAVDITAAEATFNMDFAAGTTASGTTGTSDLSYQPSAGTDLIWSPTTAKQAMEDIINNATTTLVVENEELTSTPTYIMSDLESACNRGVDVKILIENEDGTYTKNLNIVKAGGCTNNIHVYTDSNGFYIHAKAVVADYGLSTQKVYMGSINYSDASMTQNRELGMYVTDQASVSLIYTNFIADYNGAAQF
ncbi:MAG: choice-of-anchor D domain-containing protein [Acidobacteriaceae bacterium]|nr:choice-of-anchor D domain-containing protein [Acidobacteriaceae bacterium]